MRHRSYSALAVRASISLVPAWPRRRRFTATGVDWISCPEPEPLTAHSCGLSASTFAEAIFS